MGKDITITINGKQTVVPAVNESLKALSRLEDGTSSIKGVLTGIALGGGIGGAISGLIGGPAGAITSKAVGALIGTIKTHIADLGNIGERLGGALGAQALMAHESVEKLDASVQKLSDTFTNKFSFAVDRAAGRLTKLIEGTKGGHNWATGEATGSKGGFWADVNESLKRDLPKSWTDAVINFGHKRILDPDPSQKNRMRMAKAKADAELGLQERLARGDDGAMALQRSLAAQAMGLNPLFGAALAATGPAFSRAAAGFAFRDAHGGGAPQFDNQGAMGMPLRAFSKAGEAAFGFLGKARDEIEGFGERTKELGEILASVAGSTNTPLEIYKAGLDQVDRLGKVLDPIKGGRLKDVIKRQFEDATGVSETLNPLEKFKRDMSDIDKKFGQGLLGTDENKVKRNELLSDATKRDKRIAYIRSELASGKLTEDFSKHKQGFWQAVIEEDMQRAADERKQAAGLGGNAELVRDRLKINASKALFGTLGGAAPGLSTPEARFTNRANAQQFSQTIDPIAQVEHNTAAMLAAIPKQMELAERAAKAAEEMAKRLAGAGVFGGKK